MQLRSTWVCCDCVEQFVFAAVSIADIFAIIWRICFGHSDINGVRIYNSIILFILVCNCVIFYKRIAN